jgi:hypothetical protein
LKYIDLQVKFAKEHPVLIKEMAEYAVMFCIENKVSEFNTLTIADNKIRKKMARLGETIYVTYSNSCCFSDSSVTFHEVSIGQGVREFIYDFKTKPRNDGSEPYISKESATIRVSERIYYRKRPFPVM